MSNIILECQDIGEAIKEYVCEWSVGADAWQHTGVFNLRWKMQSEEETSTNITLPMARLCSSALHTMSGENL